MARVHLIDAGGEMVLCGPFRRPRGVLRLLTDDPETVNDPYRCGMALKGEYEPSPAQWVRDQVELYEGSGGAEGNTLRDTGLPIIVVTTLGVKSGKIRKIPLMRVEHDGEYALVASKGGAPAHPVWYYNLKDNKGPIEIQDGQSPTEFDVREISGDERATWWERAVAAFPPYAEYQAKTDRQIPVFLASPRH
jgi:deazaflavin-dependent oxidoreductase (nitroreductase family)